MVKHGKHFSRNMGCGRSQKYAARKKLGEHFAGGHFGTVTAHSQRFNLCCDFMRDELNITDLSKIKTEHLMSYAAHLKKLMNYKKIAISTATNRLSSCNVVLKIMRGDRRVRIDSICEVLGDKRSYIRRKIPNGMDRCEVSLLQKKLADSGHTRVAAIVGLTRACGMRLREAILADLPRLKREILIAGKFNIQNGTKGGRSGAFAPRWILATEDARTAIDYAIEVSPRGSRNLLSTTETYKEFLYKQVNSARETLHWNAIKGFHELRAAYSCSRFEQITGYPAPVISKRIHLNPADKKIDKSARIIISRELGHNRIEVTNSYLGSNTK